jgi:hypothetical protein
MNIMPCRWNYRQLDKLVLVISVTNMAAVRACEIGSSDK